MQLVRVGSVTIWFGLIWFFCTPLLTRTGVRVEIKPTMWVMLRFAKVAPNEFFDSEAFIEKDA